VVVPTPPLPAGRYEVTADLTASSSAGGSPGENKGVLQLDCWVTPNSVFASNSDRVRSATYIGQDLESLSVSDLVTTSRSGDELDLVCTVSPVNGPPSLHGDVTHASIIALAISP
jgi:hypothetical protein